MHDLYYKGRIHTRHNHINTGYNTKPAVKLGSEKHPLTLVVNSEARKIEIEGTVREHGLFASVTVDKNNPENILDLNCALNKPSTISWLKLRVNKHFLQAFKQR